MDIERRVERLERQVGAWRRAFVLLAGLTVVVLATGAIDASPVQVVRAKRFQLVGGEGDAQVLADLGADGNGNGQLVVYSVKGRPLAEMKPRNGSGVFRTYNASGFPLVELGATSEHKGELAVYNDDGHRLLYVRPTQAGAGAVFTFNEDGFGLVEIGARPDGRAQIKTLDGQGHMLLEFDSTQEGAGSVTSYNLGGHRVARIGSKPNGKGMVAAFDGGGAMTSEWPADESGGTVEVFHTVRARNVEIVSNDAREVLVRMTQAEDGQGLIITYTADGKDTIKIGTGGGRGGQISRYDGDGVLTDEWPGAAAASDQAGESTIPGGSYRERRGSLGR